jgi:DNA/RNA non-specific endonuclease
VHALAKNCTRAIADLSKICAFALASACAEQKVRSFCHLWLQSTHKFFLQSPDAFNSKGKRPHNSFSIPDQCQSNIEDMRMNYKSSNHIKQLIELMHEIPNGLQKCLQDKILNSKTSPDKQFHQIISRGHLAASSDFVTKPERAATFCYWNAAPQWQITNGGNFEKVEKYSREIVSKVGRHLEVYTGTHGNAKVCCFFYHVKNFHYLKIS